MTFPGNEGQSGGWPGEQSPQGPYSPGQGRPDALPHHQDPGHPGGQSDPYEPRPGAPYGSAPPPYGTPGGRPRSGYEREEARPDGHGRSPYDPGPPWTGSEASGRPEGEPHPPAGRGRRARPGPTPRARRRNLALIAGGAVLAGLVLIGGGIGISGMLDGGSSPTSAKSPASPRATTASAAPTVTNSPTRPRGGLGNSRATDPRPLTVNEIFRHRRFAVAGKRYAMTAARSDRVCGKTVNGAKLVAALRRGSCTQVLRATFASGDGRLIGTVGVANLRSAAGAKAVSRVWNDKDAWVQPVPGPGITKKIGTGSALGTFRYKGHYLLMTWVQQPNGKEIPSSQHPAVSKFSQDVMLGSGLFEALNYRGNEGKPLEK
ncbi:MAG TPA: hypothetical protein VGP70_24905 [Actinomadura sp.]|nr:hypothetical protein [Actinomadura sp.]